jgi:hypothetical protein
MMMRKTSMTIVQISMVLLLLLLMAACSSNAEVTQTEELPEVAPTSTLTPLTATATEEPSFASSPEDIVGVWLGIQNKDGMYQQFNADGTCSVAIKRESLETDPNVTCNYWFEESTLYLEPLQVKGLPECKFIGIYQVQLLSKDEIKFKWVEDKCPGRTKTTTQVHERVE